MQIENCAHVKGCRLLLDFSDDFFQKGYVDGLFHNFIVCIS